MILAHLAPITATGWSLLIMAALVIGVSKTGFPGVGILAIPLAAMVFGAKPSTGIILPMLLLGDVMAVGFYRRHAVWKYLVKLMPCAMAGIVIGHRLLGKITDAQLKPGIGLVILLMLLLSYLRNRHIKKTGDLSIPDGWWFAATMGVIAGLTTMMANAAGPIMIIYLLAMRLPKDAFLGTGAWYYLILNAFKIPFSMNLGLVTHQTLLLNASLAPVIICGALAGFALAKVVSETWFTRVVQFLAAAAALQLVLAGLRHP